MEITQNKQLNSPSFQLSTNVLLMTLSLPIDG